MMRGYAAFPSMAMRRDAIADRYWKARKSPPSSVVRFRAQAQAPLPTFHLARR